MKRSIKITIGIFVVMALLFGAFVGVSFVTADNYKASFNVDKVTEADSVETNVGSHPVVDGQKFIIAEITIANKGKETLTPTVSWFKISHDGVIFNAHVITYSYSGEHKYVSQSITSGASMTSVIIFSISKDIQDYKIVCTPPSYVTIV